MPHRSPRVLIVHAPGTNRDHDMTGAIRHYGGLPQVVLAKELYGGQVSLAEYDMVVLPGGFSYGDDLGAGRIWGAQLRRHSGPQLRHFASSGRPILGVCNGFQALLQAGLLDDNGERRATLAANVSGRFECRWVTLGVNPESPCVFTRSLGEQAHQLWCLAAHAEGRLVLGEDIQPAQVPLRYVGSIDSTGAATPHASSASYPYNPNGSDADAAALCSAQGNVFGLMPHPENAFELATCPKPRFAGSELGGLLLQAGLAHAQQVNA